MKRLNLTAIGLAVTVLTLVACSDGSIGRSGATVYAPLDRSSGVASSDVRTNAEGKIKFAIAIPRAQKPARVHPSYVSPSTKSMTIAVAGGETQPFNLTATSRGCTTDKSTGSIDCEETMSVPAGKRTIAIATYDELGGNGDVLSTATTSATIVANETKQISVTLEGVVASASVQIGGSTSVSVPEGTPTSLPVTVDAYDAKNNLIVAPGGYNATTAVTLKDSDSTGSTSLSASTVTKPGSKITLSYKGASVGSATITAYVKGSAQRDPLKVSFVASPVASPTSLTFDTPATQTFTVSETGYTGKFTMYGCSGIAIASPTTPQGPSATVTVTPVDGGGCYFTIADTNGNTTQVKIAISGGGVIIHAKRAPSPAKGEN